MYKKGLFTLFLIILLNNNLFTQTTLDYDHRVHPEKAKNYMVVSQNSLATDVGYEILQQGGNAIDAAIATSAVLAVSIPNMNGLGGDSIALWFDQKKTKL